MSHVLRFKNLSEHFNLKHFNDTRCLHLVPIECPIVKISHSQNLTHEGMTILNQFLHFYSEIWFKPCFNPNRTGWGEASPTFITFRGLLNSGLISKKIKRNKIVVIGKTFLKYSLQRFDHFKVCERQCLQVHLGFRFIWIQPRL